MSQDKNNTERPVEQHEAAPAGVDALTDQKLIAMWSAGNRAILAGAGSRSVATAMRVAVGKYAPLESTGNGADERAAVAWPNPNEYFNAWLAVCNTLEEVAPDWHHGEEPGMDKACRKIRDMASKIRDLSSDIRHIYAAYGEACARAPRTEVAGAVAIGHGLNGIPRAAFGPHTEADRIDHCGSCGTENEPQQDDVCPTCGATCSLISTWGAFQHERYRNGQRYANNGPQWWEDGPQPAAPQPPSADAAAAPADERAAFEAWLDQGHRCACNPSMWKAWQARAAASQPAAGATIPAELHHDTAKLVRRFAHALGNKLLSAQRKYGYSDNWMRDDWADECRAELTRHIQKGDPRDVAAYCAFLWHHNESTAAAAVQEAPEPACWITREQLEQLEDLTSDAWVYWRETGHVAEDDELALYTAPPAQVANRQGLTNALRQAREELSNVEWENDPPARVTDLFSTIDALLEGAKR